MSSLTEQAYRDFKNAVFEGKLAVGVNYTQKELCRILATSTAPVREALKLLQHEGFVSIKARSYVHICKPDLTVFREVHQLRRIFEMAAISHYALAAEDEDIQELRKLQLDQQTRANSEEALTPLADQQLGIERLLHRGIIKALRNPTMLNYYDINMEKVHLIRLDAGGFTLAHILQTADEHLAIIDAVINRDADAARDALKAHLRASLERAIVTDAYA